MNALISQEAIDLAMRAELAKVRAQRDRLTAAVAMAVELMPPGGTLKGVAMAKVRGELIDALAVLDGVQP